MPRKRPRGGAGAAPSLPLCGAVREFLSADSDQAARSWVWRHRGVLPTLLAAFDRDESWVEFAAEAVVAADKALVEDELLPMRRCLANMRALVAANTVPMRKQYANAARKAFKLGRRKLTPSFSSAFDACVHIVSEGAGSGVVVDATGVVLTCAHCVPPLVHGGKDRVGQAVALIWPNGDWHMATCVASNDDLDAALLQVELPPDSEPSFPYLPMGSPAPGQAVVCVGNPASYDLENDYKPTSTWLDLPVFHSSHGDIGDVQALNGAFAERGLGPVSHSAWTYWGHSGAPLIAEAPDGGVVVAAIHSSWDDKRDLEDHNRHGVPCDAIQAWVEAVRPSRK